MLAPPNGLADAVAVNGPDGTVKFPVYTATPFTIRTPPTYPLKKSYGVLDDCVPIVSGAPLSPIVNPLKFRVLTSVPLRKQSPELPFLTSAA